MRLITSSEWETAIHYLTNAPDGAKLPYSWMPDNTRRKKLPLLYDCYQTYHSFIKINGLIYGLAQGKDPMSILGAGSFGKVKFAQNELKEPCLLKIGHQKDIKNEPSIYKDLGLSPGWSINPVNMKFYLVMPYLGVKLGDVLHRMNTDVNRRIRIGINLCLEVHALHYGLKSKSHTPYVHWDLTQNNITVDGDSKVHLIDYGLSRVLTGTKAEHHWGTYMYRPLITRKITDEQAEVEYLLHNLYLPTQYPAYDKLQSPNFQAIYTHSMLANHELLPILDTSLMSRPNPEALAASQYTALNLAAIQIVSYYQLAIDFEHLVEDRVLSLLVTTLYQRGHDAQTMKLLLSDCATTLLSLYPQAQGCQLMASLLLINDALHLGEDVESLANNPDNLKLIQRLDLENMLRHYRVIQAVPAIKAVFLNPDHNKDLFNAAKNLLLAGSYQVDYIRDRWQNITASPGLEASISLREEQARFICHQKYSEQCYEIGETNAQALDLFLRLCDYLNPLDIEFLSQSERLKTIILSDSVSSQFFSRLVWVLDFLDKTDYEDDEVLVRLEFLGLLYQRGLIADYKSAIYENSAFITLALHIDSRFEESSNTEFNSLLKKISDLTSPHMSMKFWLVALDDDRFTKGFFSIDKRKTIKAWVNFWQNYYHLKTDLSQKPSSFVEPILFAKIDELIVDGPDFIRNYATLLELKDQLETILFEESFPLDVYPMIQFRISAMLEQVEIMQSQQGKPNASAIGLFKPKACEPSSSKASIGFKY